MDDFIFSITCGPVWFSFQPQSLNLCISLAICELDDHLSWMKNVPREQFHTLGIVEIHEDSREHSAVLLFFTMRSCLHCLQSCTFSIPSSTLPLPYLGSLFSCSLSQTVSCNSSPPLLCPCASHFNSQDLHTP